MSGLFGPLFGKVATVTPELNARGQRLKLVLIIQGVLCAIGIIFGYWRGVLLLVNVVLGIAALWDKRFYKLGLLELTFMFSVLGAIITSVDGAVDVSIMVEMQRYAWEAIVVVGIVAQLAILQVLASIISWKLFKQLVTSGGLGSPAALRRLGSAYRGEPNFYTEASASQQYREGDQFVPFGGTGHRLGG